MARALLITENYKLVQGDIVSKGEPYVTSKDKRNFILSMNTNYNTLDFYINYLETLQIKQPQWEAYGYFDLGMVPMAMGPSVIHNLLRRFIIELCQDIGVKAYDMYPTVLLRGGYKPHDMEKDIWVFRSDIAKVVGKDELSFSTIDFFNRKEVKDRWVQRFQESN